MVSAYSFAGSLILFGIVNVLVDTRGQLNLTFCHSSAISQGSLIVGHVCIGRIGGSAVFMYGSLNRSCCGHPQCDLVPEYIN